MGDLQVIVLPRWEGVLNVVPLYRHVGTYVSSDGSMAVETGRRCTEALAVYIPLAKTLFGCTRISPRLRLNLAESLVFSRLFFNAQ